MLSLLAAVAACGRGVAGSESSDADGTVKIGLIVPLSGVYTGIGESMRQGIELYLAEHGNELGGHQVELVVADEGADPNSGVAAARRLLDRERVDVITGVVSTSVAQAIEPMIDSSRTLFLASNGLPYPPEHEDPSEYAWVTSFPPASVIESMGKYLAQKFGQDGVFFIGADYAAGRQLVEGTREVYAEEGGKVSGEAFAPLGTTQDYQPYLAQIRQSGAKAVYSFFAGADAVRFVQQFAQYGLKDSVTLHANGALVEGAALRAEAAAAVGTVTNWIYSEALETPENKAFVAAYSEKYDAKPDVFAMDQYDAAAVLDRALQGVDGAVTGDALVEQIRGLGTIKSPRGDWVFDEHQLPAQMIYLREVRKVDGEYTNVVIDEMGYYDGFGREMSAP